MNLISFLSDNNNIWIFDRGSCKIVFSHKLPSALCYLWSSMFLDNLWPVIQPHKAWIGFLIFRTRATKLHVEIKNQISLSMLTTSPNGEIRLTWLTSFLVCPPSGGKSKSQGDSYSPYILSQLCLLQYRSTSRCYSSELSCPRVSQ